MQFYFMKISVPKKHFGVKICDSEDQIHQKFKKKRDNSRGVLTFSPRLKKIDEEKWKKAFIRRKILLKNSEKKNNNEK